MVGRSSLGPAGLCVVAVGAAIPVACRTPAGDLPARGTQVRVWVTSPVMAFSTVS